MCHFLLIQRHSYSNMNHKSYCGIKQSESYLKYAFSLSSKSSPCSSQIVVQCGQQFLQWKMAKTILLLPFIVLFAILLHCEQNLYSLCRMFLLPTTLSGFVVLSRFHLSERSLCSKCSPIVRLILIYLFSPCCSLTPILLPWDFDQRFLADVLNCFKY